MSDTFPLRQQFERFFHAWRKSCRDRPTFWLTVLLFLGAFLLFSTEWFYGVDLEGKSSVGAERVLRGELPYRDFWTMYAPGHYYVLALIYRLFGVHLFTEVLAATLVSAAAACIFYWVSLSLLRSSSLALIPSVAFVATMYNTGYFKRFSSYPTGIVFVFLALLFIFSYFKNERLRYLLASGLALGGAFIFKHDVAIYTFASIVIGLFVLMVLDLSVRSALDCLKRTVILTLSAGIVLVPALLYFLARAQPEFIDTLFVFPANDFRFSRPESFPLLIPFGIFGGSLSSFARNSAEYVTLLTPSFLFLLGLVGLGMATVRQNRVQVGAASVLSMAFLLHYSAAHIQINTHVITMSAYGGLLGLVLLDQLPRPEPRRLHVFQAVALSAFLLVWFSALMAKPVAMAVRKRSTASPEWNQQTASLDLPKVSGFRVPPQRLLHLTGLKEFIEENVPADEHLYIGLTRHDVIIINDVFLYFLLDRPSATRYHELHPAIADTERIQEEIVRDLREKKVRYIVLSRRFSDAELEWAKTHFLLFLPNVGSTVLDDHISSEYEQLRNFGSYQVWGKKVM